MMSLARLLTLFALVSFVLHIVWESLHVQLYTGYEHWAGGVPVALLATIGDVLYTLGAFALVSGFKGSAAWIEAVARRDYLMLVTLGFLIALFVEYKGLALNRWQYLPDMPLIPFLQVGFSPIIQMALLLPLTIYVVSWAERRYNGRI